MLADATRLTAFHNAMTESIADSDRVLDAGTGTGILAAMASQLTAGTVVGVKYLKDAEEGLKVAQAEILAQRTQIGELQLALVDAPGRVATEPDRTRPFPERVDRTRTGLNDRVDLVLLLGDALHDGVHRSVLRHRYPRLGRRLIRVALPHQPPRRFKRRSPDASTIFEAVNHLDSDDTVGRT
ncbi:50S ribosomal protein L11 methyltransferase [Streptomyces sp. NPDC002671]